MRRLALLMLCFLVVAGRSAAEGPPLRGDLEELRCFLRMSDRDRLLRYLCGGDRGLLRGLADLLPLGLGDLRFLELCDNRPLGLTDLRPLGLGDLRPRGLGDLLLGLGERPLLIAGDILPRGLSDRRILGLPFGLIERRARGLGDLR